MNKDLEKEFNKVVEIAKIKIIEQIKIASEALSKAEKISEEYGIPFYAHISPISNTYIPATYNDKWSSLDEEEVNGVYIDPDLSDGWRHSAVC